jgi:hypothetical protein
VQDTMVGRGLEEVAELVDEALGFRRHFVARLGGKFLEQFALARVQLRRHLHENPHVEITPHLLQLLRIEARLQRRQSLAPQSQYPPRLRSLWNLELDLPIERRHLDFCAEHGLDESDGNFEMEIRAITFKERMLPQSHHDVEVTGFAARNSGLALAAHAQSRAVIDARRNFQLDGLLAFDPAGTPAFRTGVRDDFARTAANVAGPIHTKKSLLKLELPHSFAATAAGRPRAFGRARPRTGLTARHLGNLDARLTSVQDIGEVDSQVVPEVGAPLSSATATAGATARAAEDIAEKVIEEIAKIAEIAKITPRMTPTRSAHSSMTESVVARSLFGIGEDGVGLGDLFETLLGRRIVRIAVGVAL